MPAGNIRSDIARYHSVLDEVHELYEKYSDSCDIIWIGDLNGAFTRQKPHKRDHLLRDFCNEMGFGLSGDKTTPTFHNSQSGNSFRIDHILQPNNVPHRALNIRVLTREATNMSPHDPVIADIIISSNYNSNGIATSVPELEVAIKRIPWKHVDRELYYQLSEQYLKPLLSNVAKYSPEELVNQINKALYKASAESLTKKPPKNTNKRRTHPWDIALKPLALVAKHSHWKWKCAGKPQHDDSPEWQKWKRDKKFLRSAQRQLQATHRKKRHQEIMDASHENQSLFFKLVKQQRSSGRSNSCELEFSGQMLSGNAAVLAWAEYFEQLATPKDSPAFDAEYKETVNSMYNCLHSMYANNKDNVRHLTTLKEEHIEKLISTMKSNKASDLYGLSGEHLKFSHPTVTTILADLFNRIISSKTVPKQFQHGVITPVYKQKNSDKNPDNYRRITITSTVGKLFEKMLVIPTKSILLDKLNRLQRGFCSQASSINAAFIISEAIAEAKDCKQTLFTTYLDASKAFDVVFHMSMLVKLHHLGITDDLWQLYCSMYSNMSSQVKWCNLLSPHIVELQGVRQGGIPSTELFKARGDELLHMLSDSGLGYSIGAIDVSAPTCADDMTLLASSAINLQAMINLTSYDSSKERYSFSTTKTKIMVVNNSNRAWSDYPIWELGDKYIDISNSEVHLGITRTPDSKANSTVQLNIQKARRTGFALMGAGVYGLNGLHIRTNLKIFNSYQLPRLLYGLEVMPLLKMDKDALDLYHRSTLKHLQHLPAGTATVAIYLILGLLPASITLARNILTLYVNMIRDTASLEHQIVQRQLSVKDNNSKSWIIVVKDLLLHYNLPSAYELFDTPPTKRQWKTTLNSNISKATFFEFSIQARRKITLQYLNIDICKPGSLHPVWSTVLYSPQDILRACTKVRILTGQYRLQSDVSKQSGGSPTCQLCQQECEDLPHFLLSCVTLREQRSDFLKQLKVILSGTDYNLIVNSRELLMQLIVDSSMPSLNFPLHLSEHLETLTRLYCYALHTRRSILLERHTKPAN